MEVHPMRDHLGIGLGAELIAGALELATQFEVVLDDAVVDDGEAVAGEMRMGVALARHPVRRPAGMRQTHVACDRGVGERLLEHAHLARGAQPPQLVALVDDRDARGVIATVFQPLQAIEQHRHDVAIGDTADNAAHSPSSSGDPASVAS